MTRMLPENIFWSVKQFKEYFIWPKYILITAVVQHNDFLFISDFMYEINILVTWICTYSQNFPTDICKMFRQPNTSINRIFIVKDFPQFLSWISNYGSKKDPISLFQHCILIFLGRTLWTARTLRTWRMGETLKRFIKFYHFVIVCFCARIGISPFKKSKSFAKKYAIFLSAPCMLPCLHKGLCSSDSRGEKE